ncbi:MAG TPA: hypothetical protein VNK51_26820 [Bradyrhizobium sp.]|nr:hypothetical protein [Bradyrhizobium sp.]
MAIDHGFRPPAHDRVRSEPHSSRRLLPLHRLLLTCWLCLGLGALASSRDAFSMGANYRIETPATSLADFEGYLPLIERALGKIDPKTVFYLKLEETFIFRFQTSDLCHDERCVTLVIKNPSSFVFLFAGQTVSTAERYGVSNRSWSSFSFSGGGAAITVSDFENMFIVSAEAAK